MATLTSREFNQDTGQAKRLAQRGPVFITDRGKPSFVLMSVQAYRKLAGLEAGIVSSLAQADGGEIPFDPPRATAFSRPARLR